MKDAQCAETNEKTLIRFLAFEWWSKFLEYLSPFDQNDKKKIPEDAQCSETDLALILTILRFLVFKIWSIVYSNFVVN